MSQTEKKPLNTAEETLALLAARTISHTSRIVCACCGQMYLISNRYKTPWQVRPLGNGLCQIWIECPKCMESYDITTCILTKKEQAFDPAWKSHTRCKLLSGAKQLQTALDCMAERSCWFEVTPLADDRYLITAKDEGHIQEIASRLVH